MTYIYFLIYLQQKSAFTNFIKDQSMKKKLQVSLLIVALCCFCGLPARALEQVNDVYQITNAEDLVAFSKMVRNGSYTISGELTADIDLSGVEWDPIGTGSGPWRGTFDGHFHKILNLVQTSTTGQFQGLFGRITGGADIKNVIIDKSCSFSGDSYVGAIAGGATGSGVVKITNCGNEANVTATTRNAAGIIGVCYGAGCQLILTNCYNAGDISGYCESATISGYEGTYNGSGSIYTNVVNYGTIAGNDSGKTMWRATSYVTANNCYDVYGVQGTQITDEIMASGAMTYSLNGNSFTDVTWYQNIEGDNIDAYPTLDSTHGIVYPVGTLNCDGTLVEESGYSNENKAVVTPHTYEDGICSVCNNFDPDFVPLNDGFYEISTAAQLRWFAIKVNKGDFTANAKLLEDIDFSDYSAQDIMIGYYGGNYRGVFDGQGHKVTVNYTRTLNRAALFASIQDANIKNLVTDGYINTSAAFAGGIFASSYGNLAVENCISYVEITSTLEGDGTNGGIGAFAYGSGYIRNCAFYGSITGDKCTGSGGILGFANGGANINIVNTLMAGTANLGDNSVIISRGGATITNTYYVEAGSLDTEASTNVNAVQTDLEKIGTGELCYLLNNSQSDSVWWWQNVDVAEVDPDEYPTPIKGNHAVIYAVGTLNCDGTPGDDTSYSNTNNVTILPHEYEEGVCSFCHITDSTYMTPVDSVYEISTPEQLRWFAYKAHGDRTVSAKLLNDIDFSAYTLAEDLMIGRCNGTYYLYGGNFDGQGHTITIEYKRPLNDAGTSQLGHTGLFYAIGGATIKNLMIKGSIESGYLAGALTASFNSASTVENVVSAVDFKSSVSGDASIGGISGGCYGTTVIKNCAFIGSIDAPEGTGNGGIISYSNSGGDVLLQNCYVAGTFNVSTNSATFGRNNPSLLDCYYSEAVDLDVDATLATMVTVDQVKNGGLAYLLNGKVSGDSTWVQTLGTDEYPLPFGDGARVYATGEINCDATATDNTVFANEEGDLTQIAHNYDDEGQCSICNSFLISTPEQLVALAENMNAGALSRPLNITLANDLDFKDIVGFPGIGTADIPYYGTFDGQYHRISNLVIDEPTVSNRGLFSRVGGSTLIKNLVMDSTNYISGNYYVGGVVGNTVGTSGLVRFENVGNEGQALSQGNNAAGIIGCNGASTKLWMTNCYNTGTITGKDQSAGLTGWANSNARFINCYNSGKISGIWLNWSLFRYWNGSASVVDNCYEIKQSGMNPDEAQVTEVSPEQVLSGELCYLLNGSVSGGDVFYQTLGTDTHPTFVPTHAKVYEVNGEYTNNVVGIKDAKAEVKGGAKRIYSTDGVVLPALQKGINIVRENGVTKKVLVK